MRKLHLALLWHMHQPYYKDPATGGFVMPWVFLHAIKDYYDMPRYCELYGCRATFNLVPSLMEQLKEYADLNVNDDFLNLVRKHAENLDLAETAELVPQLFFGQAEHMILPYANYRALYNRYQKNKDALQFNKQEIRDLCVHFLLAWTGPFTRKENPYILQLMAKGRDFSEDEKQTLLAVLHEWVGRIIDYYAGLHRQDLIEVTTTPYYHPILPLLAELDSVKEALPEISLPKIPAGFAGFEHDAQWHTQAGVEYFKKQMGFMPAGMWPAEGSVSNAAFKIMAANGIKWAASDEDVLGASLVKDLRSPMYRNQLYKKYIMDTGDGEICLFFRDKKLSDLLGFTYANMETRAAVSDFVTRLRAIYERVNTEIFVPVILDGENAWEYYPEGAFPFFTEFYQQLKRLDWLEFDTFGGIAQNADLPAERLNSVRAGSWIYGNFITWMGHHEKNRAWELLMQTAADLTPVLDGLPKDTQAQIRQSLHIAQGSDWFWWYGDDHFTTLAAQYDNLFRGRLINVYNLAGINVPADLYNPIKTGTKAGLIRAATNFINPRITGRINSFFEWMGAGMFDVNYDMGSMHMDDRIMKYFYWGFGGDHIYFRLDGDFKRLLNQGYRLDMEIMLDKEYTLTFELNDACTIGGNLKNEVQAKIGDIVAIAMPKKSLDLENFAELKILFKLMQGGKLVERVPAYNYIEIPSTMSGTYNWLV